MSKTLSLLESGAQGRTRTGDTRIFSPVLYQLSYLSVSVNHVPNRLRILDASIIKIRRVSVSSVSWRG